jgi:hypothetical protein
MFSFRLFVTMFVFSCFVRYASSAAACAPAAGLSLPRTESLVEGKDAPLSFFAAPPAHRSVEADIASEQIRPGPSCSGEKSVKGFTDFVLTVSRH